MTEHEHVEKPKVTLSQILSVAMIPIVVIIVIPLNIFLGLTVALLFAAIAVPAIIAAVLLLSQREKKTWAARE